MGRNTCIVSVGSFCSWLAFVLSGIALFSPYWFTFESVLGKASKGIVLTCTDFKLSDAECEWTLEDTIDGAKEADKFGENWLTVQVLWIVGCACFLLNAILSFLLCCDSCRGPFCSITLTVLVFIASACLTIAVIIFGAQEGDEWSRETTLSVATYYDWGFYVAIVAAISSVIATVSMGFIICCTKND